MWYFCRVHPLLLQVYVFVGRELLQHKKKEKTALYRALVGAGNGSVCPVLRKVLPFGMAYHHSGM